VKIAQRHVTVTSAESPAVAPGPLGPRSEPPTRKPEFVRRPRRSTCKDIIDRNLESRAEYGEQVIEDLSAQLLARVGRGYSTRNLWYF
jgi:hypothetical protein